MTAVITRLDITYGVTDNDTCTVCNQKLWPPFVLWRNDASSDSRHILICGDCTLSIKDGLMADLIQVAAIKELNRLGNHLSDYTFTRNHREQLAEKVFKLNDDVKSACFTQSRISELSRMNPIQKEKK